ncbi:hypothetical protein GCM10008164_20300 [Achromobacter xylosoxidans]|nr:hypothetical protein GCM10008164_20300 [Achromobacter xylosoxidans]
MANRIDWIMSFIRCATLIAPSTLKAVDGSEEAAGGAAVSASAMPAAGFWGGFMGCGTRYRDKGTPGTVPGPVASVGIGAGIDLPISVA